MGRGFETIGSGMISSVILWTMLRGNQKGSGMGERLTLLCKISRAYLGCGRALGCDGCPCQAHSVLMHVPSVCRKLLSAPLEGGVTRVWRRGLQEEERERRMDFVPEESAVNTEVIEVLPSTLDGVSRTGTVSLNLPGYWLQ